jgi:putative flippase GtrA
VPAERKGLRTQAEDALASGLSRQFGRFATVGAGNTAISFVVYAALHHAGLWAPAAAVAAFLAGAANGYWWNGRWTFAGEGRRRSIVRYSVVQVAGAVLSGLLVALGTDAGLGPTVAFVAALAVVTASTFTANRYWAFAVTEERPSE